jgi:hypothetical protein
MIFAATVEKPVFVFSHPATPFLLDGSHVAAICGQWVTTFFDQLRSQTVMINRNLMNNRFYTSGKNTLKQCLVSRI